MGKRNYYLKDKKGKFVGSIPVKQDPPTFKTKIVEHNQNDIEENHKNSPEEYVQAYTIFKAKNIPKNPHLPRDLQPHEIIELTEYIEEDLEKIEFFNHASPTQSADANRKEEWLNLAQLTTNPAQAKNNCFAATSAVSQHIHEKVGLSLGWSNSEVELYFEHPSIKKNNGVHWANIIEKTDTREKWVLDYTAVQFDNSAPFPLIAKYDEWKKWVSSSIKNTYGQDLTSEQIY
jgi:hypothetical protein